LKLSRKTVGHGRSGMPWGFVLKQGKGARVAWGRNESGVVVFSIQCLVFSFQRSNLLKLNTEL